MGSGPGFSARSKQILRTSKLLHSGLPFADRHLYFPFADLPALAFAEDRSAPLFMPKRTFQPNRRRRSKAHGFRTRMKTKQGRAVISRRRAKGRKRVSVKPGFRE